MATMPFLIIKLNPATGLQEGSFYNMTNPTVAGDSEVSTPYASLVPAGETRPIHITHATVSPYGPLNSNMQHVLLVESPAGSGKWQIPLCWVKEGQGGPGRDAFNPGILLNPGDELCMQDYPTSGIPTGVSYAIQYTIGP